MAAGRENSDHAQTKGYSEVMQNFLEDKIAHEHKPPQTLAQFFRDVKAVADSFGLTCAMQSGAVADTCDYYDKFSIGDGLTGEV